MIQKQKLQSELRAERTNRAFEICKQAIIHGKKIDEFYLKIHALDIQAFTYDHVDMEDQLFAIDLHKLFIHDLDEDEEENYYKLIDELSELIKLRVNVNAVNEHGISLLQCIDEASSYDECDNFIWDVLEDCENYTSVVVDRAYLNFILERYDGGCLYIFVHKYFYYYNMQIHNVAEFYGTIQAKLNDANFSQSLQCLVNYNLPIATMAADKFSEEESKEMLQDLIEGIGEYNRYINCESQKYMLFSYGSQVECNQDSSYNDRWLPEDSSKYIGSKFSDLLKPRCSFIKYK